MAKIIRCDPLRNSHYAAVRHTYTDNDGVQHAVNLMALKDDDTGLILDLPGYEVFCAPYRARAPFYFRHDPRPHLCYVASVLNYIFKDNYWKFKVSELEDVTSDMLYDAFDAYAYTPKRGKQYRSQQSIDLYVNTVCAFFANIATVKPGCKIDPSKIYDEVKVCKSEKKKGEYKMINVPIYKAKSMSDGISKLERNISPKALDLLVSLSEIHDPMLTFAILEMVYTGVRLGEALNTRQKDSPVSLVPGIEFSYHGDAVTGIKIDLRKEFQLRSDGKKTGGIKKHRQVRVYPPFVRDFMAAYDAHMELLKTVKFEADYCPMFVNHQGKAMTEANFHQRFSSLVKNHFVPALLASDDPRLVAYGQNLQSRNLTPHVFRHYFTVSLVLDGLSAEVIAGYRGDSNTKSADIYVRNKGAFVDRLNRVHDSLINDILEDTE